MTLLKMTLATALATLTACASGDRPATAPDLPADVAAFKEKRDGCDHFRGEEPYDPARARVIAAQLEKLCTGTDRELVALRAKYRGRADVLAALADYEHPVE